MSSELSHNGSLSRSLSTPAVARQLTREEDLLAAKTRLTHLANTAHAFIASSAINNTRDVLRDVRDALTEDQLGADIYADIVRAYGRGVRDRVEGFGS